MAYTLRYSNRAAKQVRQLPPTARRRILDRGDELAREPRGRGVLKLQDREDPPLYRVRVGDYRMLFVVDDQAQDVLVVAVGLRRDVYRR